MDADALEGCSSSGDDQEEVSVIKTLVSEEEAAKAAAKSDSQWKGFIRKLKKGPSVHFQTFHPSIPHILSIKKLSSRKRASRSTHSLPELSTQLDGDLYYCFETSWKCFTLTDLKEATNNFSPGDSYSCLLRIRIFRMLRLRSRLTKIFTFLSLFCLRKLNWRRRLF